MEAAGGSALQPTSWDTRQLTTRHEAGKVTKVMAYSSGIKIRNEGKASPWPTRDVSEGRLCRDRGRTLLATLRPCGAAVRCQFCGRANSEGEPPRQITEVTAITERAAKRG